MFSSRTLLIVLLALAGGAAGAAERKRVGPGTVRPIYGSAERGSAPEETRVAPFLLDARPVTNAQFLAFVGRHPQWRRDRVKRLFADDLYLKRWAGPQRLGPGAPSRAPVVQVSWFAARAYCRAQGGRLPTEAEWELAASAGSEEDPGFAQRILSWYARPTPRVLPPVGAQPPNPLGLHDLHGLVWEWVDDFANTLVAGDARDQGDADRTRFCGSGAVRATDSDDYAAFMRVAFRSSLEGRFTVPNLGFRCAADLPESTR